MKITLSYDTHIMNTSCISTSPGGGIGRRKGLKIPREQSRAGSTPALGK